MVLSPAQDYGLNPRYPLFDPCGRYGRFNGVTERANGPASITGAPCWTDPWRHNHR